LAIVGKEVRKMSGTKGRSQALRQLILGLKVD